MLSHNRLHSWSTHAVAILKRRIRWSFAGGLAVLTMAVLLSVAAPVVTDHDPISQDAPSMNRYLPPSTQHIFGCDQFGRDVFARVLYGGRVSLLIASLAIVLSVGFGIGIGVLSGLVGGFWDHAFMRMIDAFLAFPVIFLAVTCLALVGGGIWSLIIVLSLTGWMDVARLVRTETLSLKNRTFVLKARSVGLGPARIILRHILPNIFSTVLAVSILRVADVLLLESALSFLGLGVQPPDASWGAIVSDGRMVTSSAWWLTVFPGLAIVGTVASLHVVGEHLRPHA